MIKEDTGEGLGPLSYLLVLQGKQLATGQNRMLEYMDYWPDPAGLSLCSLDVKRREINVNESEITQQRCLEVSSELQKRNTSHVQLIIYGTPCHSSLEKRGLKTVQLNK